MPTISNTKTAILITLWAVQKKGGKHYSTLPVFHALKLLAKIHGIFVQRRWYFQCFRDLEDAGFIRRKKRFSRHDEGKIEQIPSLITFTIPGLKHLVKNKVAGAYKALQSMIKWMQTKDRRFPQPDELLPKISDEERAKNIAKVRLLFDAHGFG